MCVSECTKIRTCYWRVFHLLLILVVEDRLLRLIVVKSSENFPAKQVSDDRGTKGTYYTDLSVARTSNPGTQSIKAIMM